MEFLQNSDSYSSYSAGVGGTDPKFYISNKLPVQDSVHLTSYPGGAHTLVYI